MLSLPCPPAAVRSFVALLACLATAGGLRAQSTYYWDKTGTDVWSVGANWSLDPTGAPAAGAVPAASDFAVFNGSGVNGATTVQLTGATGIAGMTFANTGTTTLQSSSTTTQTLTLGTGGITVGSGAGVVTIGGTNGVAVTLLDSQTWANNSGSLLSVLNGVTGTAGTGTTQTLTLSSTGAGGITLGGVIGDGAGGGAVALVVNNTGAGATTLSGANTFTGGITVKAGALRGATSNAAFGTGTIVLGDATGSANVTLGGAGTYANAITVAGGNTGTATLSTNSANAVYAGPITLNTHNLTFTNTGFTIGASGGVSGAGNLTITSTSTNAITLSGSAVNMTGTITNNGAGTATTSIAAPVGSNVGNISNTAASALTVSGGITLGGDRVYTNSGGGAFTVGAVTGTAAAGTQTVTFTVSGAGALNQNGVIGNGAGGGVVAVLVNGAGTGLYVPSAASTYTGGTTLGGSVGVVPQSSTVGPVGALTSGPFGTGPVTFTGSNIRATTSTNVSFGNAVTFNADTTFLTAGANTDRDLTLAGPVTLSGTRTFTANTSPLAGATGVYLTGPISGAGASDGLTKAGPGTLLLGGANTYTGVTAVNAGVLVFQNTAAMPGYPTPAAGQLTVAPGATLALGVGAATGQFTAADVNAVVSGTLPITFAASGTSYLGFDTSSAVGGSFTLAANLANPPAAGIGVNKVGFGTLSLTGANTYSGPTQVSAGYLTAADGVGLPAASNLTIAASAGNPASFVPTAAAFERPLGTGAGQMQITGGTSGFTATLANQTVDFGSGGTPAVLTWGGSTFNPSALLLNDAAATGALTFANPITLGTAARTVTVNATAAGTAATLSGQLTGGAGGGLTKAGAGTLVVTNPTNSYTGATTVSTGTLIFAGAGTLPTGSAVTISTGATLQVLNDSAGTLAYGNTVNVGGTQTLVVGNNGGATTGSTVAFGAFNAPATATNTATTTTFTGANGYSVSFTTLALPGSTGATTILAANTPVTITGNVTNRMSGFAAGNFDTLNLQGTATGSTVAGVIADASGGSITAGGYTPVTKAGTGTWTLSGANTYTGATTVNAGTLQLLGTAGGKQVVGGSLVTVNAGGTLAVGTNVFVGNGTATLQATQGTIVVAGSATTPGTLSLADGTINTLTIRGNNFATPPAQILTLGGAAGAYSVLNFETGAAATDQIVLSTGTSTKLTLNAGGAVINLTALPSTALADGAYNLLTFGTGSTLTGAFTLGTYTAPAGKVYYLSQTATNAVLNVAPGATAANVFWTGAQGASWTATSGGATNFADAYTGGSNSGLPLAATNVFFTESAAAANFGTTLGQAFTVNSLSFTGTGSPAAANPVTIAGSTLTPLTITAAAGFTDQAAVAYPAGTGIVVQAGSAAHVISAPVVLGGPQTWEIDNAAASPLTVSGVVSGPGTATLTKGGAGTLVLSGTNTYAGGTVVADGTLSVGADLNLGALPGTVTPANVRLNGGTLRSTAAFTIGTNRGIYVDAAGGALSATGGRWTINSLITGPGKLTLGGNNVQANDIVLQAGNTYAGGTVIAPGAFIPVTNPGSAGPVGALTSGPLGTGTVELAGGSLRSSTTADTTLGNPVRITGDTTFYSGGTDKNLILAGPITLSGTRTLTVNTSGASVFFTGGVGDTTATDGLVKAGTGTLVLGGANTFRGGVTLNTGTLTVTDPTGYTGNAAIANNGFGTGTVTLSGGTLNLRANGDGTTAAQTLTYANPLVVTGTATVNADYQAAAGGNNKTLAFPTTALGAVTLNATGASHGYTLGLGTVTLTASGGGASTVGASTSTVWVTLGGVTGTATAGNTNTLVLGGVVTSAGSAVTGVIADGAGGGAVALVHNTVAPWTLGGSGSNTYTGLTTVAKTTAAGALVLAKTGGAVAVPGNLTVGDGTAAQAHVVLAGDQQIAPTATVTFTGVNSGWAYLQLQGHTQTLGGVAETTPGFGVIETREAAGTFGGSNVVFNIASGTQTYQGYFRDISSGLDATNSLRLTKTGAGTLQWGAAAGGTGSAGTSATAHNYSGGTDIQAGTLQLLAANTASAISLVGAGNVTLNGGAAVAGTLDLNGLNAGITGLDGTAGVVPGQVVNNGSGTAVLTVGNNNNAGTFAGLLRDNTNTGAGVLGLTKTGTGTQVLTGINTYSGPTTLAGGSLSVGVLANGGQPSNIGQAASGPAGLVFSGGTLLYTGGSVTIDRAFTINAGTTGTVNVAQTGVTLTLPGATGAATTGALTKSGPGTLTLTGANTYTGNTNVTGGTLTFGPGASVATAKLLVGYGAAANAGAVIQPAGTTLSISPAVSGVDVLSLGGTGGYGYYLNAGGTLSTGQLALGGNSAGAGTTGIFEQTAGSTTASAATTGGWIVFGWAGTNANGVINLTGGTITNLSTSNDTKMAFTANTGSFGMINLLGPTASFDATGNGTARIVDLAGTTGNFAGVLNLNGGVLKTNAVRASNAGTPSYLGFNGGTLRANVATTTFVSGLTAATIYAGGATVDTNGVNVTIPQVLLAPTGAGLTAIPVAAGGSGYVGPPAVRITGGGGTGATAIAVVDLDPVSPTYGQVTGFTITSPGSGYTSAPAVTLFGGGAAVAATPGTAATGANVTTGGLTKLGAGTLTLSGANTYGGPTVIGGGTLAAGTLAPGGQPSAIGTSGGAASNLVLDGGLLGYAGSAAAGTDRDYTLTANGGGFDASGTANGSLTLTGTLAAPGAGARILTLQGSGTGTAAGTLSGTVGDAAGGAVSVTKAGAGTWNLTNPANSFTGGVNINQGALGVPAIGPAGSAGPLGTAGTVNVGSAALGGTLLYTGAGETTDRVINLAGTTGGATLDQSGTGLLKFTSAPTPTGAGSKVLTLQGSTAGPGEVAGLIADNLTGTNTTGVTKLGTGTWTLSAANTYSGPTTITAGTLVAGTDTAFGTGVVTLNGGTVAGTGPRTFANDFVALGTTTSGAGGASNVTLNGTLTNSGGNAAVLNTGTGTLTLTGNVYLSEAAATGRTLTLGGAGTTVVTAPIANFNGGTGAAGGLTKAGTGTVTLTNTSTYTGATAVQAGTLVLGAGGNLGATAVTVSNGATFAALPGVTGATTAVGGALTLSAGSALTLSGDGATSILTVAGTAAFTGGAGSTLAFDIGGATTAVDRLAVTGAASGTGGTKFIINSFGATPLTPGSYTLVTALSGLATANFTLQNTTVDVGTISYPLSLVNNTGSSVLTVGAGALGIAYWTGAQDAAWTTTAGGTNWATDAAGTQDPGAIPTTVTDVYMTATGAANLGTTLGANFTVNSLTYTSGSGPTTIAPGGAFGLTITGGGVGNPGITSTSAGDQTVTAPITLGGAQVWANNGTGTVTVGTVANGGFTLTTAGTGTIAFGGPITGTGGLTKTDTGTTVLSAANGYTGTTTITQGTLRVDAAQTLTGGLTFGAAAAGTTVGTLDLATAGVNATFGNLTVQTNSTAVNTITVAAGKTLTFTGAAVTVGYVEGNAANVADVTKLTIAGATGGAGSLVVNNPSAVVSVGVATSVQLSSGSTTNVLDVSTLGSVSFGTVAAPITTLNVAFGQNAGGTLVLSNTANVITATTLNDGHSNAANAGTGQITLGAGTNVLNVNTINIGLSKASGTLGFATQADGSPGTVTIQNKAGTGAAAITIGSNNGTNTGATVLGTLDLRGHVATVTAAAVTIGNNNNSGGAGNANGVLSFDAGTFTATSLSLGLKSSTGTGSNTGNQLNVGGGTFTVTGNTLIAQHTGTGTGASGVTGTVNLTGGTLTLGNVTGASKTGATNTGTAAANINVSGGSLAVTGSVFTLATQTGTSNGSATGLLKITGGSVTTSADITDGGGSTTTTVTLNGGTLDLAGHAIGSATTSVDVVNLQAGTLRNVGEVNNGAVLNKTTTGALTLDGTNTFTGGVNMTAGQLNLNSPTALGAGAGTLTISAGTTLDNTQGAAVALTNNNPQAWNGDFAFAGSNALNLGAGPVTLGGNRQVTTTAGTLTVGGVISGGFGLTKVGNGTLELTGNNAYTGGTAVNAGTLRVNNTTGSGTGTGAVTVGGTGTVAGTGTLGGNLSAASGGTVAPGNPTGNGVGALAVGGNVSFASGAKLAVELAAPGTSTALTVTGGSATLNFTAGSVLVLTAAGAGQPGGFDPDVSAAYTVATMAAGNGGGIQTTTGGTTATVPNLTSFGHAVYSGGTVTNTGTVVIDVSAFTGSLTDGAVFDLSRSGDAVVLSYTSPVPEPVTAGLIAATGLGLGGLIRRRHRKAIRQAGVDPV